jgi:CRP/FNR family transcriptional regulator
VIASKPLLRSVSPGLAAELDRRARVRTFDPNEEVFAEGEDAAFLPIVVTGRVKMLHYLEPGKEVIIGIFEEGEMFAVPPVFDGKTYPSTAVTMEPSRIMMLGRDSFLELIRSSDEFAFAVIGWMCEMLREKTSTIQNLATASPEQRVGKILLKLAAREGGDGPVKIALRRRDIAEMAGLTTETTIRVIRNLAAKGMIEIVHGKVLIDPQGPLSRRR